MSYYAFTRALSDEIGASKSQKVSFEEVHRRVFERWLAEGRHEALIRYVVENFDGAEGGEDYFKLLGNDLVRIGRPDLIRKLYAPAISRRRNHFFWRRAQYRSDRFIPRWVQSLLVYVSPGRRALARYKKSALELMQDFRAILATAPGMSLADIDRQIATLSAEETPAQPSVRVAVQKMDEEGFWALVASARAIRETEDEAVATIEASLVTLEPAEIARFQSLVHRFLNKSNDWTLWAVAYAARGGCGDDEFDYFRQWLILQGKAVYEAAIANPIEWALDFEFEGSSQCEGLLSAAPNAYRSKTRQEMPPANPKQRRKPTGEAWRETDLAIRFPELAARFDLR